MVSLSVMADPSDDAKHIEKLYEFGERLSESKDKSQVPFPPHPTLLSLLPFAFLFCVSSDWG